MTTTSNSDTQIIQDLLSLYSLTFQKIRTDIPISGSPERCIQRSVVEDTKQQLWLVEQLARPQSQWREKVGELTYNLATAGAPFVHGALQTDDHKFVAAYAGSFWQLTPFLTGSPLPRPDYIDHAWRGKAIGQFISGLQKAGSAITIPDAPTPQLPAYIEELYQTITKREPAIAQRLVPIRQGIKEFISQLPSLPKTLCHGDAHPLNIIWGKNTIIGVIDWEFSGKNYVLYDVANCIGCVGFEHPSWLVKGLIPALITELKENDVLSRTTGSWLSHMVLALRFAWLSEWLRKNDREMIDMELDYMEILLENSKTFTKKWGLSL